MSADDYPGPDGETLRRQRLPGAAERWEALPWENRMALLGGLAEEAASFKREAGTDPAPVCDRYRALATTWETAHAALMRADTVSSKDKSPDEVAAERAKYGTPRTQETVLRGMLAAYEAEVLAAEVAYFKADRDETVFADGIREAADEAAGAIRGELAAMIAGDHDRWDWPQWIHADYEARLSGARPIDAPPAD